MSNIGRRKIKVPKDTKVFYDKPLNILKVEGPLDTFEHKISDNVEIELINDFLGVKSTNKKLRGTENALIQNLIIGVTEGFRITLKLVGVGFRVSLEGDTLIFKLGYSHDIEYKVNESIQLKVPKPDTIVLFSTQKELLKQVVTQIRSFKKPDSYKGKGILFENEKLQLKEGKKK
jgi:large subunit ribosomal protein L6